MSNHPEFSPASLRILQFKYARATEVPPTESPALALQNYNTSRLKDGALASVYSFTGFGTEEGQVFLYTFKRNYSGPAIVGSFALTPAAGGGLWVRNVSNEIVLMESYTSDDSEATLTADAPLTQVLAANAQSWNSPNAYLGLLGKIRVEARVMVRCGAVGGAVVTLALQGSAYDVVPSFATLATETVTLLADQYTQVTLVGYFIANTELLWAAQMLAASAAQDAYVNHIRTDVTIQASNRGFVP